jgi:aminodeoxyfutalosine deaminase
VIVHHGRWVLPIAVPPIRDGWVAVDRGRIVAVGGAEDPVPASAGAPEPERHRHGTQAILPGLVNAHTHLELSWLRGRVPPADSMPDWAARLIAARRSAGRDPVAPIVDAIADARAAGTALVGDVGNTDAAFGPLIESPLSAHVFREVLGFNVANPLAVVADASAALGRLASSPRVRWSIVPHAPYSVAPGLLRTIGDAPAECVFSIHLGESRDELEFLQSAGGKWRVLLETLGVWTPAWTAPGSGPVDYLDRLGLVNERLLAVHAVQLTDPELERLARARATIVTCPRSNRWTGAGDPPIDRFYASGANVALGTDSLASVDDLNVFAELAAARSLSTVPARSLLASATAVGAAALGFGHELGTLEPGRRAELIAVDVPPGVEDVEEYLVSGIAPSAVRWLHTTP